MNAVYDDLRERPGFRSWLRKQTDRLDAVGDLARDLERDACFPERSSDLAVLKSHLREHRASFDAVETLGVAFAEWLREQGR